MIRHSIWIIATAILIFSGSVIPAATVFAGQTEKEETGTAGTLAREDETDSHSGTSTKENYRLEQIIVTAEKREQDVKDVGASITVINETQFTDFNIKTTKDVVSMTPNLYIIDTGNGLFTTFAAIRGITGGMTGIPSLGFYVDDVYYPNLDISLFDVERIEVLRGPHGTLYGRNCEAGVINVVTKKPSDIWEGSLSAGMGSFNSREVSASVSGPVVQDKISFRGAVRYFETDGYFENSFDGSDEAGAAENTDVRLSLGFTPTDRLKMTLGYDFQNYDSSEYANFAPIDQEGDLRKNIDMDYPGEAQKDTNGGFLKAVYQMDEMQLVSVTSARNESNLMSYDTDYTSYDMMTMTLDREVTSFSQELRLVSDDNEASFQWLFGVFLLSEQDDRKYDTWMNFMTMGMGMPGETLTQESSTDTTGTAAFGQISYEFENQINICLGLRYDYEKKEFDYTQTPSGSVLPMMGYAAQSGEADESFDAWLPKVVFSYRALEHVMPYASVSKGFRSGGFNDSASLGSSYAPEFTWNYELGAKTSWFGNRLQLNAALFYIDWSDMQVEITSDGGTTVYIDNAAKATSKGAELELTARPMAGLELMANAALTHAEYDDYTQGTDVYDGKRIIDSPEYTLNFGVTYRMENGIFIHTGYTHLGKIYHDLANTESQEDYGLVDAKIGYETELFDIYIYGENIFDEEYVTRAGEVNGTWYGRAGAPQTFGITATIRF